MNTTARTQPEAPPQRMAPIVGQPEQQSILTVWRALRKNWPISAVVAVLVMLAVAFYTAGQTKIYRSQTTIQLDPSTPRPLGKDVQTVVDVGTNDFLATHQYLETQFKIIQSKRVALAVVERLGLDHDPGFLRNKAPAPGLTAEPKTPDQATELLRERLSVEPVKDSRLAFVKYEDASPERAQRILSTLVEIYISQNLDDTLASVSSAVEWLRSQLDKLKVDLESSEMALHEFKEQKNLLALEVDDQSNVLREQLRQLSTALTTVKARRQELAAKRAQLHQVPDDDPRNLSASELLSNPLLSTLRQRYEDAIRERDEQLGLNKGKNHVDVRKAEAAVAAARDAVLAEARNIRGAADRDLAAVQAQEGGLVSLLSEAQRHAVEVNLLEIQYNRLRRARENNDKLYSLVLERTKETDLQRLLRVNNIRVVDTADLAHIPIRPRIPLMVLLALFAGIASGLGVAVGLVAVDRTIKTPEDIEIDFGVTCLGILPMLATSSLKTSYAKKKRRNQRAVAPTFKPELVVHEAPHSNVAEAARAVRTNLMFMSPDNPIRSLLVTSANPGEGKTTVACCMAIAIAHAGHRTLLVDCDLRRPRIHRVFGKSATIGLTTALLDDAALDRAIVATDIPNLFVLPAGPIPPNPADLMHSERFRAVIDELRVRFDRVVIDSSPIAPVTDATILSAYVDATMLVVRAFVTKKEIARHALRAILDIGSKTAGIVLNAVDFARHEYRYASYYGRYGYGDPYGSTPEDEAADLAATREKPGDKGTAAKGDDHDDKDDEDDDEPRRDSPSASA